VSPNRTSPDGKPSGFTQVPNAILKADLSQGARLLYSILLSYCRQKEDCFPSYDTLMSDMHCHSEALRKYIKELIAHGLITVVRRGQGRSNRYILSRHSTTSMLEPVSAQEPEEVFSASHIAVPVLRTSQTEEYRVEKDEEEYESNLRTAENEKPDYVNPKSTALHPDAGEHPTAKEEREQRTQERAGESNTAKDGPSGVSTDHSHQRNKSKLHITQEPHPVCEEKHKGAKKETAASGEAQYVLQTMPTDEAKDAIRDYIRDIRGKLHDEAPLESSTTRTYRLYQRAGIDLSSFFNRLYDAETEANRRSGSIRKRSADGFTNRMPYFFAVLEDKLHLQAHGIRYRPQTA
jgi:hypothetical protein